MRVAGGESQWRVVGGGVEVAGARGSTSRALLQGASIGWFERDGWGAGCCAPGLARPLPLPVRVVRRVRVLEGEVHSQRACARQRVAIEVVDPLHEVGVPASEGAQGQRAQREARGRAVRLWQARHSQLEARPRDGHSARRRADRAEDLLAEQPVSRERGAPRTHVRRGRRHTLHTGVAHHRAEDELVVGVQHLPLRQHRAPPRLHEGQRAVGRSEVHDTRVELGAPAPAHAVGPALVTPMRIVLLVQLVGGDQHVGHRLHRRLRQRRPCRVAIGHPPLPSAHATTHPYAQGVGRRVVCTPQSGVKWTQTRRPIS